MTGWPSRLLSGDRRAFRPVLGPSLAAASILLGFLAATNRWMSWSAGFNLRKANDEISYRAIASAFPSLPSQRLPEQHAERFPVHYLIGGLAQLLSVRVELVYRVMAVVVVIGIVAMLVRILWPFCCCCTTDARGSNCGRTTAYASWWGW